MSVNDTLHVSDLTIPKGLKVISPVDMTIAVVNLFVEEVVAPTAAAVDAATAAAAGGAAAAPAAGAAAPAAGAAAPAAGAKAAAPAKDKK